MIGHFWKPVGSSFGMLLVVSLILISCTPELKPAPVVSTATSAPTRTQTHPTITATPLPLLEIKLEQGNHYFTLEGRESFILSRNPTGKTQADFDEVLDWAKQGGGKILRVHLTHGWWGDPWINQDGTANAAWIGDWERFFDQAETNGMYVIPVFGVWADWNNGTPDLGSPFWQYNPLNKANGGPIHEPGELLISDSDAQQLWLNWMGELVQRWHGRKNIVAWEIFSEINIASALPEQADNTGGPTADVGIEFTRRAVEIIEKNDRREHPITLSLAGVYDEEGPWGEYYSLDALDFIEIHPYTDSLDRELISDLSEKLTRYNKPVFIGESGLWAYTHEPNAALGTQHAIWAAMVSGAMNGRSFWDQDGYSIYFYEQRSDAIQFMQAYARAELPAAKFSSGHDFSGYEPLQVTFPKETEIWGGAVGNEETAIGWVRDAKCEPPAWSLQPILEEQSITINLPGTAAEWKVDFYNTKTGTDIISSTTLTRKSTELTISLPDFKDDIAFKMAAVGGTISTAATATTDPIAGKWNGTISNASGTFSTLLELEIQTTCEAGRICGKFSAPQISCSGDLFLNEIAGETFVMIEQNVTGAASCASGGYEYLQLQPDGSLNYMFAFTPGATVTSNGNLHHP